MNWLLVFLGGGIGSVLRFGTSALTARWWQHTFPLATLLSNVIACLVLGITVALLRDKMQSHELWYTFVVVGICGGYSTFSTFAKENLELFEKGNVAIGVLNIAVSLSLCIIAVYLGRKVS
jgi:fluoride exporter